jgi:hypothetical protein
LRAQRSEPKLSHFVDVRPSQFRIQWGATQSDAMDRNEAVRVVVRIRPLSEKERQDGRKL